MYKDYYLQASQLSDRIARGELSSVAKPQEDGLVSRRQKPVSEPDNSQGGIPSMILDYFVAIDQLPTSKKPNTPAQPTATSNNSGSYEDIDIFMEATSSIESGGDYEALGPVMEKGQYKGDRAYGKYQVMGGNIPSWTKEALGVEMTPEQFLSSPKAQEAVKRHRAQKMYKKYGNWEDVASVWFTGQPVSSAGKVDDGFTTNDEYLAKFKREFKKAKG